MWSKLGLEKDSFNTKLWTVGLSINALISGISALVYWGDAYSHSGTYKSNQFVAMWVNLMALALSITAVLWFLAGAAETSRSHWYNWFVPAWDNVRLAFALLSGFATISVTISYLITPFDQNAGGFAFLWWLPSIRLIMTEVQLYKTVRWTAVKSTRGSVDEKTPDPYCGRRRWAKGCSGCTVFWVLLFALSVAFNAILASNEYLANPMTGQLYTITMDNGVSAQLHMYCTGTRKSSSSPLFIFQHGGGAFGLSFYQIQQLLAQNNIRSCAIDRSGSGWSPQGSLKPTNSYSVNSFQKVLDAAGESAPYVVVGHSAGVELSILFSAFNPTKVTGMVLLDGYPEYRYLVHNKSGDGTVSSLEANVKYTNQWVIFSLDAARALAPVGWMRSALGNSKDFEPANKASTYSALYRTNRAWNAQYQEYWSFVNAPLSNSSTSSDYQVNITDYLGGHWTFGQSHWTSTFSQPLGNLPILVIPAGATVGRKENNTAVSCSEVTLSESTCEKQLYVYNAYFQQSQSWANSLSNNGSLVVCPYPCDHSFPWTKPSFVVDQIINFFGSI
jgi:pimeloyl-ACP methyl ester carboxylesterase